MRWETGIRWAWAGPWAGPVVCEPYVTWILDVLEKGADATVSCVYAGKSENGVVTRG